MISNKMNKIWKFAMLNQKETYEQVTSENVAM